MRNRALTVVPLSISGQWIGTTLVFASVANTALVLVRILLTGQFRFLYLPGNLFLAWLPLVFAVLAWGAHKQGGLFPPRFYIYSFLWLLFLPNAPYIMTDMIHLSPYPPVPIWVDMVIIFSFAWTGFMLGFISLYLMQRVVAARLGVPHAWVFVLLVLALTGLGIYIGRFMRWNSWDLFLSPLELARDLARQFRHPLSNPGPILYTVLFTKVLLVGYLMLYAVTRLPREEKKT